MRLLATVTLPLALAPLLLCAPFTPLGCSDMPRGEQGIDFLVDGAYYNVPPSPEAGPDARGPCEEDVDAGLCAQASSSGTPANHLISCTDSDAPFGVSCVAPPSSSAPDAGLFCCTTGLL